MLTQTWFILKYETVQVFGSDDYITIEDALYSTSADDVIILVGSDSGSDYVITSFTSLDSTLSGYNDEKYYILSCKLRVPFDSVDLDFHGAGGLTNVEGSTNGCTEKVEVTSKDIVYSVLMIPNETITLTIASGGILNIGGLIAGSGDVSNRGVVMNNGYINAQNGSKICSYGYLKGTGLITADGAILTDVFRMWDWRGGAYASGMNTEKIFPLNGYSTHNISCDTKILPETTYESFWTVMFNNTLYKGFQRGDMNGNIQIIGTSGMFNLTDGYIMKSAENSEKNQSSTALLDITGDNQIKGQKDVIKIYGTCVDNSVTVTIKATGTSFDMKSSQEMPLPVGYMDVVIGKDGDENVGHLTLKAASYKFYPGSSITIDVGGKLTLDSGVTLNMFTVADAIIDQSKVSSPYITSSGGLVIDRMDSYITVNGVLEINSGASFGGKILTTGSTGKLIFAGNNFAAVKYVTSAEKPTLSIIYRIGTGTKEMPSRFNLYDQQTRSILELSTPESGQTYYAVNGGWAMATAEISFNFNGGWSDSITSQIVNANTDSTRGFLLSEEYLNQFKPIREGYTFDGWYFNIDSSSEYFAQGEYVYSDVILFAKWIVNQYTITFDSDGGSDIDSITVDYGASIILPDNPIKDGYIFKGWDKDGDNIVDALTTMPAENLVLKALWGTEIYSITFDSDGGTEVAPIVAEANDPIVWDSRPIPEKAGYLFKGWDVNDDGADDRSSMTIMPNENIIAKAIWVKAYIITYNVTDGELDITSKIVEEGTPITLPTPTRKGYNFKGWYTSPTDGTKVGDGNASYTPTADITLYAQWVGYTVTYNANGGSCSVASATYAGSALTLPTATRDGYTFNGWYTSSSGGTKIGSNGDTYDPTGDVTLYAQWTQNESGGGGCLAEGTLITMFDGSKKKVEDLEYGDKVLVFNHETGKLEISTLIFNAHKDEPISTQDVVNLHFSNGVVLRIVAHHGIFDLTLNEYVEISKDNIDDFIGHEFSYVSYVNGQYVCESVVLNDYVITEEYIKVYSPITANQINCFAEGFLTAPGLYNRLMNIFEYDQNMTIDVAKKQQDIDKYGLYDYSVFEEYVSYEIYQAFNGQYFKVAVEKGMITLEEIIQIILDFNIKDSTGI